MAKDPYRYFRIEAHELIDAISHGLLTLEREQDVNLVRQILRHAHTLKGAARVVKQVQIGEIAHAMEDLLAPFIKSMEGLNRQVIDNALGKLDTIREFVGKLGEPAESVPEEIQAGESKEKSSSEEIPLGIRIEPEKLGRLFDRLMDAYSALSVMRQEEANLDAAFKTNQNLLTEIRRWKTQVRWDLLETGIETLGANLAGMNRRLKVENEQVSMAVLKVRELVSDLRLLPAEVLVDDLERAVRDAAVELNKRVVFHTSGIETRIDAYVLTNIRGALRHLVRNAVAHGIEDEAERVMAEKDPVGNVYLSIEGRGHRVSIQIRDDGRGFDLPSLRKTAVEMGLIDEKAASSLDLPGFSLLLLSGGMTTTQTLTSISGRGVGLDAVREAVEQLKGEIAFHSDPGKGAAVELLLPFSLSSLPALAMELNERTVFAPLNNVDQVVRFREQDVSRSVEGEKIVVDDTTVSLVSLRNILRQPTNGYTHPEYQSAVVLASGGHSIAIAVDRVLGIQNVEINNLPEHVAVEPSIAGVALDEQGNPCIVLSPLALVMGRWHDGTEVIKTASPALPPILIIDDSLTTRMLEQSILESAGYEVELAVSGEEALKKARARQFGLFIVDIEMPGMNGFEFIVKARAYPGLKSIPSILVTSRSSTTDKIRGKEVGARAFIVKSDFDQQELLETIRRLVG
ncbi:MAG: response regulator [bacterium]